MRSEEPRHFSNDFLSVDSSWAPIPGFSDVCSVQQQWTAHLSPPKTPQNTHIHPGPISEMHFELLLPLSLTSTEKKSSKTILESSLRLQSISGDLGEITSIGRGCRLTFPASQRKRKSYERQY